MSEKDSNEEKKVKKITVEYEDGTSEELQTENVTTTEQPVYLKDAVEVTLDNKQYLVEG